MARRTKVVLDSAGVDRRETGYYATPRFVADFLTRYMLAQNPLGTRVFDPCVGKEELLSGFAAAGKEIDSIDIDDFGLHRLANFTRTDFFGFLAAQEGRPLPHDYFIANPPYNCHESRFVREHKQSLQRQFAETGVANLYSMFIAGLIDLAKPGALLGLLTHDSFLTARMHAGLRRKILRECSIHLLALCPPSLFRDQGADVRTCLLVLRKGRGFQAPIDVLNRLETIEEFEAALAADAFEQTTLDELVLSGDRDHAEFVVGLSRQVKALFAEPRLGDRYPCITGISTGNDARFLSRAKTASHTVPFYKNPGSRRFYCTPDAYLPADFLALAEQTPNFQVRNRDKLFHEGVVCSSMGVRFGACYRPPETTFGVNANVVLSGEPLWTLLAFLNSSLATYLVRGVLLRSNMITSGYVARIPLPLLDPKASKRLAAISRRAVEQKMQAAEYPAAVDAIDGILADALGIPQALRSRLADFQQRVLSLA